VDKARIDRDLLEFALNPPFGYIDTPAEGENVESGALAFGWALDDSGVASVTVSADGSPPVPVLARQPHPGVAHVHPGFPDAAHAGFGFAIPALQPGPHTLTVTILARDGGKTSLRRNIQIRIAVARTQPTSRR
jgi:hypothetical protein